MRYAAIGDSFTEGVGDTYPSGRERGWADMLAAALDEHVGGVQYVNLAVRGRLLAPIVEDQLEAALALDPVPTLLTLNGGGNDMLRPAHDLDRLIELTAGAVHRCVRAGVRPVLLSGPDPSQRLPRGAIVHERAAMLTAALAELASTTQVLFVDLFHDEILRTPQYWSADRLHLNTFGHTRVAWLVLAALGHAPAHDPPIPPAAPIPTRLAEVRYYGRHVLPWVMRRLLRRSSGDGRSAKYPAWTPMQPGLG